MLNVYHVTLLNALPVKLGINSIKPHAYFIQLFVAMGFGWIQLSCVMMVIWIMVTDVTLNAKFRLTMFV
jgi:hypothetical protein